MAPLLEVDHLSIYFRDQAVVRDLSFSVGQGEVLGLVGESGSGKSLTSLSILRLLDAAARVEGAIRFEGQDLLALKPEQMRHYRGRKIAMIFQEPMTALNPVMPVGRQIAEAIETHQPRAGPQAGARRRRGGDDRGGDCRAGAAACATILTSFPEASGSAC